MILPKGFFYYLKYQKAKASVLLRCRKTTTAATHTVDIFMIFFHFGDKGKCKHLIYARVQFGKYLF